MAAERSATMSEKNLREWSPELLKAAESAVERKRIEDEMLAKMCEPCRKLYIAAWAKRMANRMVELGESELPI